MGLGGTEENDRDRDSMTFTFVISLQLGLIQKSYRLTMVSVIDHPHTLSVPSSGVELLTEPFRPFSFFCFLAQQPK